MDKKIYLVTVVLCGLLLAANLFYLYSDRPSEEDAINKELADKDRMAAYNLDQLQTICIQQLQTENVQLDENIYLFEENGDSVQMQEVLGRKDKFVIRFNDAGCTSCIEEFIRKLPLMKNFIQEIGVENIVVFLNTYKYLLFLMEQTLNTIQILQEIGIYMIAQEKGQKRQVIALNLLHFGQMEIIA